ncbi:LysR family transcriptional regulator [Pseudalkalibacillus caeni]|uniref:LysR family transcriptional regulator n=1 Tax=Exobacillus caeni TaxID=2574798 RepID=A0A5R9EY83_9BACL|nr:LysR family transcriptional regulator [Pseudalkalibacillus caeni]TLS36087.1 LysR family transcriptional regulator [Pseudalkalibacillus caeni]
MNIKWLNTFVTAATYENYRETSEKLYISQPTVSVHIQQLEKEMGTKLFEKTGRNIVLTQAGRRFLPHAKAIIESYNDGLHQMTSWQQGYSQKLTLAVSPLIASSILPYTLQQFMKLHPQIEVVVQVSDSHQIGDMVHNGQADVGLSRMEPYGGNVKSEVLYEDRVILVVPHDGGDLETSPPIDVEQLLKEETLFTYNHPVYWDELLTEIRSIYSGIRTMVVSHVHITKRFIEEGIGFSFLPVSTVRRELMEGRMMEVHTDLIRLPVAKTYLVTGNAGREADLFCEFLKKKF